MAERRQLTTEIDGRTLKLTNLDKVLYPGTGFTKAEVIDYYLQVAPYLLPHLRDRPLTRKRFPDGTGAAPFFEKNRPRGTPEWVRTVELATPGSSMSRDSAEFVVADNVATIVWLANLAALELHVPQWRIDNIAHSIDHNIESNIESNIARARASETASFESNASAEPRADLVVFDLDPGAPATIVECCMIALALREVLEHLGLTAYAKTSGSKGMHLYVPISKAPSKAAAEFAKQLAGQLAAAMPTEVTASMTRSVRPGKVFIDWSQNAAAKTTVAAYSLRGTDAPQVSTPVSWDEVAAACRPDQLSFTAGQVRERLSDSDLLAGLYESPPVLPSLSELPDALR